MRRLSSERSLYLLEAVLFALCAAPSFVSYRPYYFSWDDADYLARSVMVSRALWSGNLHGLGSIMMSVHPPAMMLLGIPWGRITSWEGASNCFITLAALQSLLAASCFYMLLRLGVRPLFLLGASVCVCASLGPFPAGSPEHWESTAFMADGLLAWTSLAAMLLIPFEAELRCSSTRSAVERGISWGLILSLGTLTKLNFLFFVGLIVPALFLTKLHYDGLRSVLSAMIAFACTAAPSAFLLLRYGKVAFSNAKAASFGSMSHFYYIPLPKFLLSLSLKSPGLIFSLAMTIAALLYFILRSDLMRSRLDLFPLMIMGGFTLIVLSSSSKDVRYLFPPIVAIPFLVGILISGKRNRTHRGTAAGAAALAFLILLAASVPSRYRADRESIRRCDLVLTLAAQYNVKRIVLATDSPTWNGNLMLLDGAISGASLPTIGYIVWNAARDIPIEEDYRTILGSDMVVFQDNVCLSPAFTNQRVSEYEQYARQVGRGPIRAGNDLSVYLIDSRNRGLPSGKRF
jgi:hypothetical protein